MKAALALTLLLFFLPVAAAEEAHEHKHDDGGLSPILLTSLVVAGLLVAAVGVRYLAGHVRRHAARGVFCACLACFFWGCWELLLGHPHHAWPAFAAAAPGAQSARIAFLARRKGGMA